MNIYVRYSGQMIKFMSIIALSIGLAHATLPAPGEPGAINDPRYCGEPERTAEGRIKRSRSVLRDFAKVFPCPATLEAKPSCVGWAIDHILPLSMGGCDTIVNLQWLPDSIKSCKDDDCKDRWERIYHDYPRRAVIINLEK